MKFIRIRTAPSIVAGEPAQTPIPASVTSLALSLLGNLSLAWFFGRALVSPSDYGELIFRTGPLLFFLEIWSFYGSVMAISMARSDLAIRESGRRSFRFRGHILVVFALIAVAMGYGFKNWFIPAFFFVSLGTKVFATRAAIQRFTAQRNRIFFGFFGTMLAAFVIAEKFYPLWQRLFPIPDELFRYKLENASGSIIDHPQTLLVWGVCYFVFSAALEVFFFVREKRLGGTTLKTERKDASSGTVTTQRFFDGS